MKSVLATFNFFTKTFQLALDLLQLCGLLKQGVAYFILQKKKGKVDKTLYGRPARARLGTPIGWAIAIN
jgi:hypothetical protein